MLEMLTQCFSHVLPFLMAAGGNFLNKYFAILGFIAAFSLLEIRWPAEKHQTIAGKLRNLVITTLHMAVATVITSWINAVSPIHTLGLYSNDIFSTVVSSVFFLVIYDYFLYWFHRAQHKFSGLWAIHELHHSDCHLNCSSATRSYWAEKPLQLILVVIPTAFFVHLNVSAVFLLPLLIILWSIFIHANLRLPLGALTAILCGPQFHRIHHSTQPQHQNKNFAHIFPVWDLLFSTYYHPGKNEFPATGTAGLASDVSLITSFIKPLQTCLSSMTKVLQQWPGKAASYIRSRLAETDSSPMDNWPAKVSALGLILGIAFSAPMWTSVSRSLPICSLVDIGDVPMQFFSLILLAAVGLSSFAIIVGKSSKFAGMCLLSSLTLLVFLDLNRLQPWVYEYALIILFYSLDDKDSKQSASKIRYVALLVLAIYFYSGMEKLNWHFLTKIGPWLIGLSPSPCVSMADDNAAIALSAFMTTGEIFIPIALLFRKTRILGIGMALVMHMSILTALGPSRLNTNAVVWPWNIMQMLLMAGCFLQLPNTGASLLRLKLKGNARATCIIVFCGLLLPLLGLMQLVDPYPAFALYSADTPRGKLVFMQPTFNKLPDRIKRICLYNKSQNIWFLDMTDWSMVESTAPVYSSKFCLSMMAKRFVRTYNCDFAVLQISTYPKLTKEEKIENIFLWQTAAGLVAQSGN